MCISGLFGGGKTPTPPPLPPPLPPPPTPSDENIVEGRQADRRRAAVAGNRDSTILTSQQGLTDASTAPKTILGT
ncbi:MAG TPA: hypothetical protein ENI11_02860 [Actinobacteria bacterium]|nr:hypothetical protein [Actinomycetota bacterium]